MKPCAGGVGLLLVALATSQAELPRHPRDGRLDGWNAWDAETLPERWWSNATTAEHGNGLRGGRPRRPQRRRLEGEGSEAGEGKLLAAFRCVSSQGFLRLTPHPSLGHVLTASRSDRVLTPADIAYEVADAAPGWVTLKHYKLQQYLRMGKPPEKPAWLLSLTKTPTQETWFRVEHIGSSFFLLSNFTGGYVNCMESGLIRGHGYYPKNERAAEREPTTEFEVTALQESQVQESLQHPSVLTVADTDSVRLGSPHRPSSSAFADAALAAVGRARRPFGGGGAPSVPPAAATGAPSRGERCKNNCRWSYSNDFGYSTIAFHGALSDFVCPTMFRDMADYTFRWPYAHFKEKVTVAPADTAAACLPPFPVVYTQSGGFSGVLDWSKKQLKRPYVLVTGQSDFAVSRGRSLLSDPNLIMWFAQNADITHPKLRAIPIGLNCFEHAPEMHQTLRQVAKAPVPKTKLVLVNFGKTHPSRTQVWEHFCGQRSKKDFVTCSIKSQSNNIQNNPHLVNFYKKVAAHKFVVAPRGNGLDTHRLWEALYLGCIPIVGSSQLDSLYRNLPVLVIPTNGWGKLTKDYLQETYERMRPQLGKYLPQLHRAYWWRQIEAVRQNALQEHNMPSDNATRFRCWG